jgi:hypothetical protein
MKKTPEEAICWLATINDHEVNPDKVMIPENMSEYAYQIKKRTRFSESPTSY